MFGNELAYYKGEATLSTLYDMEKFYDNTPIPLSVETGAADAYGLQKHQMLPASPRGHHTNQWHHCRMHT
eukprot:10641814-Karenia_brevis.AAC.1